MGRIGSNLIVLTTVLVMMSMGCNDKPPVMDDSSLPPRVKDSQPVPVSAVDDTLVFTGTVFANDTRLPVSSAMVSVVGYRDCSDLTGADGTFELLIPLNIIRDSQVRLHCQGDKPYGARSAAFPVVLGEPNTGRKIYLPLAPDDGGSIPPPNRGLRN